ncbi:MAG: thiazole biosynthesis protein, partial [Pseudomonadota bacterium]
VLRPLATTDKQEIIDTARAIGTEEFSKHIPEYCAVISKNPTTKARPERIAREEANFDFSVLENAIADARFQLITDVVGDIESGSAEVPTVKSISDDHTVIDIRHPDEVDMKPLKLDLSDDRILSIPFYALRRQFDGLDTNQHYLLYCDQGMMSRLHAAHLLDEGFSNVAVLDMHQN